MMGQRGEVVRVTRRLDADGSRRPLSRNPPASIAPFSVEDLPVVDHAPKATSLKKWRGAAATRSGEPARLAMPNQMLLGHAAAQGRKCRDLLGQDVCAESLRGSRLEAFGDVRV